MPRAKPATLHEMGRLKANQGEVDAAIALYQQSLDITERIGDVQGKPLPCTKWAD
jgi:hypothetical protein